MFANELRFQIQTCQVNNGDWCPKLYTNFHFNFQNYNFKHDNTSAQNWSSYKSALISLLKYLWILMQHVHPYDGYFISQQNPKFNAPNTTDSHCTHPALQPSSLHMLMSASNYISDKFIIFQNYSRQIYYIFPTVLYKIISCQIIIEFWQN